MPSRSIIATARQLVDVKLSTAHSHHEVSVFTATLCIAQYTEVRRPRAEPAALPPDGEQAGRDPGRLPGARTRRKRYSRARVEARCAVSDRGDRTRGARDAGARVGRRGCGTAARRSDAP